MAIINVFMYMYNTKIKLFKIFVYNLYYYHLSKLIRYLIFISVKNEINKLNTYY
jgi:hypothetical protein